MCYVSAYLCTYVGACAPCVGISRPQLLSSYFLKKVLSLDVGFNDWLTSSPAGTPLLSLLLRAEITDVSVWVFTWVLEI